MKKLLSVVITVMMVAGMVNVSAAIPTSYDVIEGAAPEIVYITQDYSDIETNTDFVTKNYAGSVTVTDGAVHMNGGYAGGTMMDTTAVTAIESGDYVFEFDFKRNDTLTTDFQIFVTFQRAANQDNWDPHMRKYGVYIPVRTTGLVTVDGTPLDTSAYADAVDIENNVWYTYRLNVSETDFNNNGRDVTKQITVERKLRDGGEWEALVSNADDSLFVAESYRSLGSSAKVAQTTDEVELGISNMENGEQRWVKTVVTDEEGVEQTVTLKEDDCRNLDFVFDNIKAYVPENVGTAVPTDYPINNGIVKTSLNEFTVVMADANNIARQDLSWGAEPKAYMATFDAKNNVAGGPLTFETAVVNSRSAAIALNPTTAGKWYSYKVIYDNTEAHMATAVYRKEAGTNSEWTLLTKATDTRKVEGSDWWAGYGNNLGTKSAIKVGLYCGLENAYQVSSNSAAGTSWSVKNIQVTAPAAVTGIAKVNGENLTVELNTIVANATSAVLAVYDGDRMVSADAVDIAEFGETSEITVPYPEAMTEPNVKMFIWTGLSTPMVEPISVSID